MYKFPDRAVLSEITITQIDAALATLPDTAAISALIFDIVNSYNDIVERFNRNMDILRDSV
jgi:hypothetical protein